jgi:hypothetical protein
MNKQENHISKNIIDFIDHCNGYNDRRRGYWFLHEVYSADPTRIEKAFKKCLYTLEKINKEGINKESEFILIDRVFELNYRVLGCFLRRKIKKDVLNNLQKINYFVQAIICGDVKDMEAHYQINKNI